MIGGGQPAVAKQLEGSTIIDVQPLATPWHNVAVMTGECEFFLTKNKYAKLLQSSAEQLAHVQYDMTWVGRQVSGSNKRNDRMRPYGYSLPNTFVHDINAKVGRVHSTQLPTSTSVTTIDSPTRLSKRRGSYEERRMGRHTLGQAKARAQIESHNAAAYDNDISKNFSSVGLDLLNLRGPGNKTRSASSMEVQNATRATIGQKSYESASALLERGVADRQKFSYAELKGEDRMVEGVNSHAKEEHLSEIEFMQVFGMPKSQFRRLPTPKKVLLKRQAKLN
jgi:hypothetical protein